MDRFIFANQLRGIAALLVMMAHYFGVYFAAQPMIGRMTASPDLGFTPPPWVRAFELPYQGPTGVAVFFLISGFVIPFSLRRLSRAGFLVNRFFRIFPTYACCLGLGLLAVWLNARYWQQPFPFTWHDYAANAALVHNLLGVPTLDEVNWTLSIELKFYLLAALVPMALLRPGLGWLLALLGGALLATAWHQHSGHGTLLAMEANYLTFMVAGTQFHHHATGQLSTGALYARVLLVLAAFTGTWAFGPQPGQFPWVTVWYYSAVLVFGLCYRWRGAFRQRRVLDFLASISYPLYCVHPLFGYSLLKVLMHRGLPFGAAVLVTMAATIGLAWLVHKAVEGPTNALGKRLGSRFSKGQAGAYGAATAP
ncbi:peptidoglycan/LPS O-acetylase OafA/YrhL [Pseudoduganella lurida]|uniref:Peptidoglycan/LPS O-acetylase OafA/YrhL n=1 Tax=Pseudoduganella lurida TaxID=1036180 RepID=A0A562R7E2_9BURK|nr:acyltransferase [Pseudoduganella lurida]TWI64340.1 peptidoglycan/LPS O-acetylase OafA/YrhL [Pseudoduganella lurida]